MLYAGAEFLAPAPRPHARLPGARAGFVPPPPQAGFVPPAPQAERGRFTRGALIRLESGALRRVEDMRTEDFVSSAERSADVALAHVTLLRLETRGDLLSLTLARTDPPCDQVEMESTVEHPFFVYGQGWASCAPERTLARYGLPAQRLRVGDVCVSLAARPQPPPQTQPENLSVREEARKRRWSAPDPDQPPHKKR